jgi:N-sulfoglucosamine sulfohydrolase
MLVGDDLGPQLGCYGDAQAGTPHMDSLAATGTRFSRAYVTQASCSPSRSSILTGLYPHQNGQLGLAHRGYSMHRAYPNLFSELHGAGYRTGILGKLHVRPTEAFPLDMSRQGAWWTQDMPEVQAESEGFMKAGSDPFFLSINFVDPHRPYQHRAHGQPERLMTPFDVEPFPFLGLDAPSVREEVAGYYNAVRRMDAGVGRLLASLDRLGLADNTLVILIGDHGPPFARAKTTCYEAGLHIPMIVRWPGVTTEGATSHAFASTVDLLPTVLDACGVDCPPVAGESLRRPLTGDLGGWRRVLCGEYTSHGRTTYFPRRSIRDDRFKLIHNLVPELGNPVRGVDGGSSWTVSRDPALDDTRIREAYDTYANPPEYELYDLERDPHEWDNLSGRPEHWAPEATLRRRLVSWRDDTDDSTLDPEQLAALTARHTS